MHSKTFCAVMLSVMMLSFPVFAGLPRIAVLNAESTVEFSAANDWTLGPEVYGEEVKNLKDILGSFGYQCDLINEADIFNGKLDDYLALYSVDTIALSLSSVHEIKSFVERGGLLISIGEFSRNIEGEWVNIWEFGDVFGISPVPCDEWSTSGSNNNFFYLKAVNKQTGEKLTDGLDEKISFGRETSYCWVCSPDTATAVAVFPKYSSTLGKKYKEVKDEVVAVSLNKFGKGYAVYIAALPGGKRKNSLASEDIRKILRNTKYYIQNSLSGKPVKEPELTLSASQIGYLPDESKFVVLWIRNCKYEGPEPGFELLNLDKNGAPEYQGKMKKAGCYKWPGVFFKGDFSSFSPEGRYKIRAKIDLNGKETTLETYPFAVKKDIFTEDAIPIQLDFLEKYAAGIDTYLNDEVTGGFMDATGDYAIRMWSMPHVVYCLAELYDNLEDGKNKDKTYFLLNHGVKWCVDMQRDDGDVWSGIHPGDDIFVTDLRPSGDKSKRKLYFWKSFNYLSTYVVGLARASQSYGKDAPDMAEKCIKAAEKAYSAFSGYTILTTSDIGNAVWASVELYKATGKTNFLKDAEARASELLRRQVKDRNLTPQEVYGDFSESVNGYVFKDQQYKVFHNLGIYMGLLDLYSLTESKELKKEIKEALKIFADNYIVKMASQSPYGQFAHGLENTENGYEVRYFPPASSWIKLHALNCDHGALGLFAVEYAKVMSDRKLYDVGTDQLQWINGQNPLNYCMIMGLGQNNPPLMPENMGTGSIPGGMPNGIGGGRNDFPTWGNSWNSREYWLPQTVYYIACASLAERVGGVELKEGAGEKEKEKVPSRKTRRRMKRSRAAN
ncbi:MAG: glycoside hydrolase family 9 protein [Candidatus Aureabacteria bacterium]|nr:glycoside hydrolase family 9 protein [Candidatus Auribacterota bacterium]